MKVSVEELFSVEEDYGHSSAGVTSGPFALKEPSQVI